MDKKIKLTKKQRLFCKEYLLDFNATRAAIAAKYSKKTAYSIGFALLKNIEIQKYIRVLQAQDEKTFGISKQMLVDELRKIAFSDIRNYYDQNSCLKPMAEISDFAAGAIAAAEVDETRVANDLLDDPEEETKVKGKPGFKRVLIGSTSKVKLYDKIRSIDTLSRMLGFDAPIKTANTDKDGNPIAPPKKQIIIIGGKTIEFD